MHTNFLTASGRLIDTVKDVNLTIEDVAKALAFTFRYRTQCNSFISVTDHSHLVYKIIKHKHPKDYMTQLVGLLHDTEEAITGDIPSGVKTMLNSTVGGRLELTLDVINSEMVSNLVGRERIILSYTPSIKIADELAFMIEVLSMDKHDAYRDNMLNFIKGNEELMYLHEMVITDPVLQSFVDLRKLDDRAYESNFIETAYDSMLLFTETFTYLLNKIKEV